MRKRVIGLLAIAAIVAGACGSSATPSPATSTAPPPAPTPTSPVVTPSAPAASPTVAAPDLTTTTYQPEAVGKTGGKLVLGEWQEPVSVWYGEYDTSAADVEAFGPSLWSLWNVTADYKYYGQLATNVPTVSNGGVKLTSSGGMDVTINLRPGANWSDGQPITCDDLAYQVQWQMDPGQVGNVVGTVGWEDITGVDGGTGTNCVAHFKTQYEGYLGLWAPVLPKHYISTVAVADASTKLYAQTNIAAGVYSGPYMPTNWAAGAEIDFVPNTQFWQTIKKATPPFDSMVYKVYGSATAEEAGFKNGEVDVAMDFNHNDLATLATLGIPQASIDAINGTTYEQNSWNYADLTTKFGADGAKALMTALHYAYNKDDIVTRILGGSASPTCNNISPLLWYYKAETCPTYDVAKANSILDAAGFKTGSDGYRVAPNGTKVEVLGCTSASRTYRINTLTLLATQLKQIGVLLDVHPVPSTGGGMFPGWTEAPANTPCNLTHGNYDVAEFAWLSSPDPDGWYLLYDSKFDPSLGDHSGQNEIRVSIPALDSALQDMNGTVDTTKILADMATYQDTYVNPDDAFPEIPLYYWKTVVLKGTNMHNVVNNATSATNTWNIEDWWRS
jgi:peptide/nickel transport system substrate-binding protein